MDGHIEIVAGALDGAQGKLDRLYWDGDTQYAEVTLEDGTRLTLAILRRESAAAQDAMPDRELGS